MTTRLVVNRSTAMGELTVQTASFVRQAVESVARLKAAVDSMSFGGDDQQVADELGIDIAKVPDFLSLLQATVDAVNGAPILNQFVARCEQG